MTFRRALAAAAVVAVAACSSNGSTGFKVVLRGEVTALGTVRDGFLLFGDDGHIRTSPDGRRWTDRLPARGVFAGARVNDVRATHLGVLAVGSRGGVGVVFRSPDGIVWAASGSVLPGLFPGPAVAGKTSLEAVTDAADGVVAIGRAGTNAAAWHSVDGRDWQPLDPPPIGNVLAVCAGPAGTLVVGRGPSGPVASVLDAQRTWSAPVRLGASHDVPRSCTVGPGGYVVAGEMTAAAKVWTSADGVQWGAGQVVARGGAVAVRITRGPGRLVVTGYDESSAFVLTSADGLVWRRIRVAGRDSAAERVAATDAGLVITGRADTGGVVWAL